MPVKGSTQRAPNRDYGMTKRWWKAYQREKGPDSLAATIDYSTVQDVVHATLLAIEDIVVNDPYGFKLPENMGYLVVTKYASAKRIKDPVLSAKLGTTVYHRNMHSPGYMYSIRWYAHRIGNNQYTHIYRFIPARTCSRGVHQSIKKDVPFIQWNYTDFIQHHKIMK